MTVLVGIGCALAACILAVANLSVAQRTAAGRGTLTGTVHVQGSLPGPVVIHLDGRESESGSEPATGSMAQRDRQFHPGIVAIQRGGEIEFPNQDRVYHNVFSLSRTKRFDLGLYNEGESRTVRFPRAGVVDVYCNIHPEMVAHILVLDTAHYTLANGGAQYVLPNVPAGRQTVVGWQRHGEPFRQEVTIEPGRTTRLDVRVVAGSGPRNHPRKDGSPYGRYR